ncbi:hypothetical protein, partial [Escherichia coli]|uniref:hypothetical protein n=1 Tax=Escherichia coli TaxID=562 RepID=UPI0022B0B6DB
FLVVFLSFKPFLVFFLNTWKNFVRTKSRFVHVFAQDISQQSATGKKNDCLVIFDSGKRRFKRKQNIFCVDNSVFTWVLILWYEQKKKNTTRG